MSTAIIYYSQHHGNTKKLLDAIAAEHEVKLIDIVKEPDADLDRYDRIGIASGIYYGSFSKQIIAFAEKKLPKGKDVFLIATCGAKPSESMLAKIRHAVSSRGCRELDRYICNGFDTFGPFKLVGGIQKGHPTEDEIRGAVSFYDRLDDPKMR